MVDRYKSLMGSQILSDNINRNANVNQIVNVSRDIVQRTNSHATKMRQLILKYKLNPNKEADENITAFKDEQRRFVKDRNALKEQLDRMQKKDKKDTPQYNFMKKQLLRAVRHQIDLDLQLNQEINKRKEQKQQVRKKMFSNSPLLGNALKDIEAKKAEILYLQKSINECLKLLEIIGILTNQTGQSIDQIVDRVRDANIQIERAQANIDKAKIQMQKSRCKSCCIIIIALIVIVLILVVMFKLQVI